MRRLHIETPLLEFQSVNNKVNGNAWLKMESIQPTGSFKIRGIGFACREYSAGGAAKLVTSSGGNAGLAVAYSGRKLGIPVIVVVPKTTTERAKDLIKLENAEVIVKGNTWQEAHQFALDLSDDDTAYIHPFDDPLIWNGHSTLIDEVKQSGLKPDAIVLSVGGGGLLCGVLQGMEKNGWNDIPVVAVETLGADSFHQSVQTGKLVELDEITSIASSLGAKKVSQTALDWVKKHKIFSHTVSDKEALEACIKFSIDHRIIVEPACGASLSVLYNEIDFLRNKCTILVIVCGGVGATMEQLYNWYNKIIEQE
ncbi:MAG TPA: pyridoxal-phosphate dependent enzyme [bacterium]|nr:pyridoxal-phosphate dependent enzyme [bacterium]